MKFLLLGHRTPAPMILLLVAAPVGFGALVPDRAMAQQTEELRRRAERRLGRDLTDQEILQRLQQSGLSPQQIRERL